MENLVPPPNKPAVKKKTSDIWDDDDDDDDDGEFSTPVPPADEEVKSGLMILSYIQAFISG